jgi:phage tail protein X
MSTQYVTKDGDMADAIAWDYYGTRDGLVVETLLAANPGLSDYGPVLPAGVTVILPDVSMQATDNSIKLWD